MKVSFLRREYFYWTGLPAALLLTWLVFGLPHFISSYSWVDRGQGSDPYARRHYTLCNFYGPYGQFTLYPKNGKCDWFIFRRTKETAK